MQTLLISYSSIWLQQLALHGFEQISIIMFLAPVMQNELHGSLKFNCL